jgi:class 3 adenylate cyclase/predicted alpha/beta hydrolase
MLLGLACSLGDGDNVMMPETHYARSGDVRIAYQVVGDGSFDLVFVPGFISNLDVQWEDPGFAHLLNRLCAFTRLILLDKRGTGLSDRIDDHHLPTLETRMDDVRAVMDAVGSGRAALLGASEGGPMSILFAATYPQRTRTLILYGSYAHFHTWVMGRDALEGFIRGIEDSWGTGASAPIFAPDQSKDGRFSAWWGRFERLSVSPSAAVALARMNADIDVRSVLASVRVPTLVIHRRDDARIKFSGGQYLAEKIAGARFVELSGQDHPIWTGDIDLVVDEIEEFLTGTRPFPEPDRVLATLLFTDIVDSTKRAVKLGDKRWQQLLDQHDAIVRREIARLRGREVKTTGDGFLATFDGPARGVRCAMAITEGVRSLGIEIRSGVHTGEIELKGNHVGGIAVNIAARVAALATGGQVLVSPTVRDLVAGSELSFRDFGTHVLKGLPEELRLFVVQDSGVNDRRFRPANS